MSSGGNPFYKVAAQDSRNVADLFNKIGFQAGEDEAKHNVQNPGRAITKAAISAATWYLGGLAGDAAGAGGTAAGATDAAESGGTLALNSAGQAVPYATQAAQQTAAQTALQYAGGLDPETQAGMGGMSVAQNGIGPGSLLNQFRGAVNNPASLASSDGLLGNLVAGSNTGKGANLALQMGLKAMQPPPQQGPMPARPPMGGQQQPLPIPYVNSLTSGQNSMSSLIPPGMTLAEYMRRKQLGLI